MKSKYNYFKVSDTVLDRDLKKSELWVYLTHCRSRGIKTRGYSIAGLKKAKELFGKKINQKSYDKAIKMLIQKGLIQEVDVKEKEINIGFYKTDKAIEVIESDKSIQLPIKLLDSKIINDMTVKEIQTVIELYSNYKPLEALGSVDNSFISAYDSESDKGYESIGKRFGDGFNRSIHSKTAVEVNCYDSIDTELDKSILQKLIDLNLFKFKPVVVEVDNEDDSLYELKYELFKELVCFSGEIEEEKKDRFLIVDPGEDKKIIWMLEPLHHVEIKPYYEYLENKKTAYQRNLVLYKKEDKLTNRKHSRYALYHDMTYRAVEDMVSDEELKKILELREELKKESDYSFKRDCLEEDLKSLYAQEEVEIQNIDKENTRIKSETGKRSRLTTNPKLNLIKHEIRVVEEDINHLKILEGKLLDLIPSQAFIKFFTVSVDYKTENEGRASRII